MWQMVIQNSKVVLYYFGKHICRMPRASWRPKAQLYLKVDAAYKNWWKNTTRETLEGDYYVMFHEW